MKKLSTLGLMVVLAVLLSGIAFTQNGRPPEQAPAAAVAAIPNVVGNWSSQNEDVGFADPHNDSEPPSFGTGDSQGAPILFITDQQGRVFAGYVSAASGQHDKLTGAVLEDGTITIQLVTVFNQQTPNRSMLWGRVSPLKKPTTIVGIANGFEELSSGTSSSFSSGYFRLTRVP